jgi:hypothetical protein
METNQSDLFESGTTRRYVKGAILSQEPGTVSQHPSEKPKPRISDFDHHMIGIVSEYINKLPDNDTKKHVARIMINFIIKSAKL